jgi:hypothetical protein
MRKLNLTILLAIAFTNVFSVNINWPVPCIENKPGVRWWWLGSAVDEKNLTWNLEELAKAGIGSVEITPIYGVKGNDANDIEYLSPKWMQMYKHTLAETKRLNMHTDMNCGTGWPFGGPQIDISNAASKQIIQRYNVISLPGGRAKKQNYIIRVNDVKQKPVAKLQALLFVGEDGAREQIPVGFCKDSILTYGAAQDGTIYALFTGRTFQQVKRAAPGGQGLVMNHFSKDALNIYLKRYDDAFIQSGAGWPDCFFNDSYEVYGADWSDNLLTEFKARRGYDISDYLPELLGEGDPKTKARVICDYRETISEMLLNNFTIPWSEWAHSHGNITRNQAHGSPGNLLDLYGAIDIPECESFGITSFDIPGFRIDSVHKPSDSNPATLKYASSAAHVTGKKYTSAESMTWLTEHFRTSLSQIKPEMDQLFLNGVNHVYFHGSPYTPKDAAWPGWLFYASILVNPNNTIFRDMHTLNEYATRVQSFLQSGTPDNEILLYFPIYDIWQTWNKGNYMTFDIHKMSDKLPGFEKVVFEIRNLGYDLDYVSDSQLMNTSVEGNGIVTKGGKYKLILVPDCKYMPESTAKKLLQMTKEGATVAFLNRLPDDVPGLNDFEGRSSELKSAIAEYRLYPRVSSYFGKPFQKGRVMFGNYLQDILEQVPCTHEDLASVYGAGFIRRRMDDGFVYFIAMQKNRNIDGWVSLGVKAKSAMIFDPLTGEKGKSVFRNIDGNAQVYLQLKPDQSLIIRTFDNADVDCPVFPVYESNQINLLKENQIVPGSSDEIKKSELQFLHGKWSFGFTDGQPEIAGNFTMNGDPVSWTTLPVKDAGIYAGTGRYSLTFRMHNIKADDWMLDFGSISESARVTVNGQYAGTVWSIPYTLNVGKYLKPGKSNTITIDVTNLPANRIADYDRRGVEWRIFKEINFVDVNYQYSKYDKWPVMPSGLTQKVKLVPLYLKH